jgi:DNA-directed RNA polymerase subunit K/omega
MADTNDVLDNEVEEAPAERPKAPPIESRFLFVDVAAMRAKQLRRGALPRLRDEDLVSGGVVRALPKKAERIAMEEVRHGLVLYETPQPAAPPSSEGAA